MAGVAAPKGSCIKKAISLKGSQTVKLVQEYDSEEKEYYEDSPAAYYSVTLKRGQAYTIWITGGSASSMSLDVDTNWEYYEDREDEPSAGFDIFEINGGATQVAYLYADDWDTEEDGDPKSGKYIVYISGASLGASTTLGFTQGIKSFTIVGSEDSPKALTMSTALKTANGKLVDGEYWFRATLKAGRKYRVRTLKGTKASNLTLDVDSIIDDDDTGAYLKEDTARKVAYNDAFVVVPDATGKYHFIVDGDTSQSFRFQYQMVPTRAIAKHPSIPLLEENGFKASFVPGRMANTHNYYDEIIDEHLCKIYMKKGEKWSFETEDATVPQQMVVYGPTGKVLGTNESMGYDSLGNKLLDTRVVVTAPAAGVYYVGVCDPTLDVEDAPRGGPITLTASLRNGALGADPYDPVDDTIDGASMLVPYPATTNDWACAATANDDAIALGSVHGPHRFDSADIYDMFAFPCRKGYTYKLRAAFDQDTEVTQLALGAKLFTMRNGKEVNIAYTGTVSPSLMDGEDDLTFKAAANGMHYLRVWVADGKGLDFPGYNLHVIAANETNELGLVKCVMQGGVGTWDYNGDASQYANGAVVAVKQTADHSLVPWTGDKPSLKYPQYKGYTATKLPSGWTWDSKNGVLKGTATSSFTVKFSKKITVNKKTTTTNIAERVVIGEKPIVKFNAVSGYTVAPGSVLTNVPAWKPGDEPVTVFARYSDIYDSQYQTGTKTTVKNGKKIVTKLYSPADGDATDAGAFAITPKVAEATLKRTLWNDDPRDTFKFTATANTYYNFSVADTTLGGGGDAVLSVRDSSGAVVVENATEASRLLLPAGVSYVTVTHGTGEKADTSYTLSFSKSTTGIVRFTTAKGVATTAYTANETASAAVLYVARTGTEGAVRVAYETHAGTALPGTNYFPVTTNEISWAAGDKSVKAIKVKLVPEPSPTWAPTNLSFTVKLLPVDETGLAEGEYLAVIPSDTATVTIKNTSAKTPGTISLSAYGDGEAGDDDAVVANVKKPVVTGTAGEDLVLTFTRTGGTDGPVSVKVASPTAALAKTNKDTALAGRDYEAFSEILSWEDGDAEPKYMTVSLADSVNYAASKKFIFTIAAVKTDGTLPALSSKTATMTILNDTVAETAAVYAKTIAASTGLKLAATGTWFNDYDGTFRSGSANGTLTYTLTGPGFFVCEPIVVLDDPAADKATLKCQFVNKTAKLNETIDCSAPEFGGKIARIVPAGTTTVKFTLSGVSGGAYVSFANQDDDAPYSWTRFALTAPSWPMDKAVVTNVTSLAWTLPESIANEEGLFCRVRFGTTSKPATVITNDVTSSCEALLGEDIEAGKTYYWALDYAYSEEKDLTYDAVAALKWTAGPATWSFSGLKDGAPVTSLSLDDDDPSSNPKDMAGNDVAELMAAGEAVQLVQGVNVKSLGIGFEGEGTGDNAVAANKFRLVAGALPKGVSINATTGLLTGAPTAVGTTTALLQGYNQTGSTVTKTVNGKKKKVTVYTYSYGTTVPVTFEVVPGGTMFGTWRGPLVEDGSTFEYNTRHAGDLTVTATSAGKITAKAVIAGAAYTFTGTAGYDEQLESEETAEGTLRHLQVELATTVKTLKNKKVTGTYKDNSLVLRIPDCALTNTVALAQAVGSAEMTLNVLNAAKTAVTKDVSYRATLWRNNSAVEAHKASMADFEGYYTVSLVPEAVDATDVPAGNGYLTMTVAGTGAVKVSGVLADGTAVSFSTFGELVGDDIETPENCTLAIPVYVGNANYSLSGALKVVLPAEEGALPVVQSADRLVWTKNAAKTTSHTAAGFSISLAPTGGWYDKVVNLQTYYINRAFSVEGVVTEEYLPSEALASGYSFSMLSTPRDLGVDIVGNAFSVSKQSLVKNKTTGLADFGTSVNPWNTTVKLNRATGIVTGTFNAWEWVVKSDLINDYASAQKQIAAIPHKGVLLFTREDSTDSPLADNVFTSGFFLMPATTSTKTAVKNSVWKASLPFNIVYEEADNSWLEN